MRKDFRTSHESTRGPGRPNLPEPASREPGPPGLFYVYGRRPILEALRRNFITTLEIANSAHGRIIDEILSLAADRRVAVRRVADLLESEDVVTQGVRAVARPPEVRGDLRAFVEHLPTDSLPLFLMLDGITDPHNFGAVLRTSECAGVTGVIIRERRQAQVTETVVKASAGAAYLTPIFHVSNLAQAVRTLKEAGLWVVAATGEDGDLAAWNYDWNRPIVLIVGAEGAGVSSLLRRDADDCVKIPMFGKIESLNVSVATGVLVFEVARTRHRDTPKNM